ncbi:MAG: hypothetical protein ACD_42C00021G0002 [uncultured bacterium]|nr:MAG: hypothetical protein ACD_42C00021G0002 [uncultured bacterium]OGT33128.1 MAG: hypothetical protein A3C44_06015 [Gammaproteobacteria bacterium RIFCSPHIGHO2_02_FULL_39_13]OGT49356.1 MAG: hypothetical protein A3E53_07525 [Gammaproteobacteria bacterium RIFCSPHIGHO2_12_FULL_39_24]
MSSTTVIQIKRVVSLALPMAGSRFLQMLSGFFATMMVSHLGKIVLASCALINATLTFVLLIFISIVFSLSFIVGQSYGAKKYDEVGALVQQGIILSLILSIIMIVLFYFVTNILTLFHQSPQMLVYVRHYFHALMWGVIPIMLQSCLEQFFYGVLKQRLVITVNLFSMFVGVLSAYILIFGKCGLPALGVTGLGLAFAIQAWFDFLLLLICCRVLKDFKKFELFKTRPVAHWIHLKKIFSVGWPMSVQFGGELGAFFVMTMMIGWLGTNALAVVQVTQQWMFLIVVPIFAMAEASGILVGQSVGAKELTQLSVINRTSLWLSLSLVAMVDVGFIFFPHFFASFYLNARDINNPQIMRFIHPLFILMAITLILNTIRDVVSGSLRGLLDTQFPMKMGLFVMWCLVLPLGYFFAFPLHMSVVGFRLGGNIGLLVGAVAIYWRWQIKSRTVL